MKHLPIALAALLFANSAFAQGKDDGGIKTPDQDPYKKAKLDPVKEFATINQQADSYHKELKGFSGTVKFHEFDQNTGKDATWEAALRAKRVSGEMWAVLDYKPQPELAPQKNIVNQKITELWPESTEYRRVDYSKRKDAYPVEVFLGWQYQPAKYKSDFDMKVVRFAASYKVGDGAKPTRPPTEDPFAKKMGEGDKGPEMTQDGPDPANHHVFEFTPKDKKLKEVILSVTLHVHSKTYLLSRIEVKLSADGGHRLVVDLTDPHLGGTWPDKEIRIETRDPWKEKK